MPFLWNTFWCLVFNFHFMTCWLRSGDRIGCQTWLRFYHGMVKSSKQPIVNAPTLPWIQSWKAENMRSTCSLYLRDALKFRHPQKWLSLQHHICYLLDPSRLSPWKKLRCKCICFSLNTSTWGMRMNAAIAGTLVSAKCLPISCLSTFIHHQMKNSGTS